MSPRPPSFVNKSVLLYAWVPKNLLSPGQGLRSCLLCPTLKQLSQNPRNPTRPLGPGPDPIWVVERTRGLQPLQGCLRLGLHRQTRVLVQTGLPTCRVVWSKLLSLSEPETNHVESSPGGGLLSEKGLLWGMPCRY